MKNLIKNESLTVEFLGNGIVASINDLQQGFKNFVVYGSKFIDRNGGNTEAVDLYREFVKNTFADSEWDRVRGVWNKKIRATIRFYELHTESVHNTESLEVIAGIYENSKYTLSDLVSNGKKDDKNADKKASKKADKKADKTEEEKTEGEKTEAKLLTIEKLAVVIKNLEKADFNKLKVELLKFDIKISRKTA